MRLCVAGEGNGGFVLGQVKRWLEEVRVKTRKPPHGAEGLSMYV